MFPSHYFPKFYFAGRYFPPVAGVIPNTGPGRLEFTVQRQRLEYSMRGRLEFTLPKTVDEFTEKHP